MLLGRTWCLRYFLLGEIKQLLFWSGIFCNPEGKVFIQDCNISSPFLDRAVMVAVLGAGSLSHALAA